MTETALGRLLKDLRAERGLTLREVAQLGEVDHAYVHRLETGAKESPSEEVMAKLVRALRPPKREGDMMKYLTAYPLADPNLIDFVRKDPAISFDEFQMLTSVVNRGARPDFQTSLTRIRRILKEEGGDG